MKFFSERFLTDYQLKILRESRKIYSKRKIVDFNSNFIQTIEFEKPMKVYPENDELLEMIDAIERFEPMQYYIDNLLAGNIQTDEDKKKYHRNYHYEKLPPKLKKYMREKDLYFSIQLQQKTDKMTAKMYDAMERKYDSLVKIFGEEGVTEDLYEKHVILGRPIPTTKFKKAKDSANRSYKQVNDYLKCNIDKMTTFITLTFAPEKEKEKHLRKNDEREKGEKEVKFKYINGQDYEQAVSVYNSYMENLRKRLKRKKIDFYYLTVWELQKNGNYHFHIVCSDIPELETYKIPKWLDFDFRKKKYFDGIGLTNWEYGKSDIQEIKSPEKLSSYVTKYILKSFYELSEETFDEYIGRKKYFPSKNLTKSTKIDFDEIDSFDKALAKLELENKDCFEKEIINPYNEGKITKKIYTVI